VAFLAAVVFHVVCLWCAKHIALGSGHSVELSLVRIVAVFQEPGPGNRSEGAEAGERGQAAEPLLPLPAAEEPPRPPAPARHEQRKPPAPARPRLKKKVPPVAETSATQPAPESEGSGGAAGGLAAIPPGGDGGAGGGPPGSGEGASGGSGGESGAGGGLGNVRAFCSACPPPHYPVLARERNWSGAVIVALRLDAEGRVEDATVERSSGYAILDREALLAARKSRFRLPPGLKPPVRGRIQYRFELTD